MGQKEDTFMLFNYIGQSLYDYPTYQDTNGKIWFDINNGKGTVSLYISSTGDENGEPLRHISEVYPDEEVIQFNTKYEENPQKLKYQLLSRYLSDCKYFLGNGRGDEKQLYFESVSKHIDEIKKLYNTLSSRTEWKPEWITLEEINDIEKEMIFVKQETMAKKFLNSYKIGKLLPDGSDETHYLTIDEARQEVTETCFGNDAEKVSELPLSELAYWYVAESSGGTEVYIKETGEVKCIGYSS